MTDNRHLLFNTLNKIKLLGSAKVSMWSIENPYAYIPFLRFYFIYIDFEDALYVKLERAVKNYEGIIKWKMIANKEKSLNHFIIPEPIKNYVFILGLYRENLESIIDEKVYNTLIDDAIKDIPQFVSYIEKVMLQSYDE